MPLEWLFGSKKKAEPDPQFPVAEVKEDDFVLVGNEQFLRPRTFSEVRANALLPYSLAPATTIVAPETSNTPDLTLNLNFLHAVPFNISTTETFHDIDSATAYQIRASQEISYISTSLNSGAFHYDFKVEKSVVQEAGSRDLG